MIVVVEGPSAGGKTTWIRQHYSECATWEAPVNGAPSRLIAPFEAESYWVEQNAKRWAAALEVEAREGLAVCDSDPLKLHYLWSLIQVGEAADDLWSPAVALTRKLLEERRLGRIKQQLRPKPGQDVKLPDQEAEPHGCASPTGAGCGRGVGRQHEHEHEPV